jgi:Divergent CRAL/TRIO domain
VLNTSILAEEKAKLRCTTTWDPCVVHPLRSWKNVFTKRQKSWRLLSQGPYVLVLVNTGHNMSGRIPSGWLFQAWRKLTRPFRKNVAYIVLVRPSKWLKALLAMVRPFTSRKAHRKVLVAEGLSMLPDLTNGEVNLHHLGPRFAVAASDYILGGLLVTRQNTHVTGASSQFPMP